MYEFQKAEKCVLCNPPENKVNTNIHSSCHLCGEFYITDDAINDYLFMSTNEEFDTEALNEIDKIQKMNRRNNIIEEIRARISKGEFVSNEPLKYGGLSIK